MTPAPTATKIVARKVKKSEFAGKGAFVQLLGIVCCFLIFPFGIVIGLLLLVIGGRMAFYYKCEHCGNRVEKDSRICPHPNCGAVFD